MFKSLNLTWQINTVTIAEGVSKFALLFIPELGHIHHLVNAEYGLLAFPMLTSSHSAFG